ncbi:MAG TPA: lipoyl(octanoyl) transferase LipB, partial [Spongiibacteraceae bacterium]|nr:lipoyl(octanoyl) transferase LipB [Spongiibacteraceae bacterium]
MKLRIRKLGLIDYQQCWDAMRDFTEARDAGTPDEIWFLQHPRVFTQGQAGKAEHVLAPGDIPVIQVDRGGQVTYHGPGQIVGYMLIDIRRRGLGIRWLVNGIENAIIDVLKQYGVKSFAKPEAPGVYLDGAQGRGRDGAKIAALGMRVRRGCTFHGLSLNIDMDLEPYGRINPCGFSGLAVAQLRDMVEPVPALEIVEEQLLKALCEKLDYDQTN